MGMPYPAGEHRPYAVIVTALGVEQLAVRSFLKDISVVHHPLGTVYSCGALRQFGSEWNVAVAAVGQGNARAAIAVERAVSYFKPVCILFVGVAGGLKDVNLGDVVVSTDLIGYERGKAADGKFLPRMTSIPVPHEMEQLLITVTSYDTRWIELLPREQGRSYPFAKAGTIASGEKVVADVDHGVYAFLKENCSHALAVEMEGIGFAEGARMSGLRWFAVVRGISDLIVGKQESDSSGSQERAAENAAACALYLLTQIPAVGAGSEEEA